MRRDFLPPVRGVENVAPARAGDDERTIARELRQLGEAPADDHFCELGARELDERVGGARGGASGGANQRDLPLRVEPFDLRRRQRPGGELGFDGRARDERDAVPGLHGAPHRLLQAELEPHIEVAQAQPQAAQLVLDDLADAGAFLHHDHVLAAQLVERDRASGEWMAGRAREDHLVVEEWLEPGGTMPARRTDDSELELARGDALDHRLRVRDGQRDLHARVSDAGTRRGAAARRSRPGRWTLRAGARPRARPHPHRRARRAAAPRARAAAVRRGRAAGPPRSARRDGRSGRGAACRAASPARAPGATRPVG